MPALLGNTVRGIGRMALATGAGLCLMGICAVALIVSLVCAAPLWLVKAAR